MKVSRVGSADRAKGTGRSAGPARPGGDFASHLKGTEPETGSAAAVETSAAGGGVEAVLSVQEVPDATDGRNRNMAQTLAQARGDEILDRLEELRRDILLGTVPKDGLAMLARKARERRPGTGDARLETIIDEIELRAEVEIAKLTREI